MAGPHPLDARVPENDNLVISWSDGRQLAYPLDLLRASCPCASCVDEWSGEVKVRRDMFPGITLKSLEQAGNYAFKITFSDGHASGIFVFPLLLKIGTPMEESQDPFSV